MDAFIALSDPNRRQIIEHLVTGECTFGDLASRFDISQPAVSQHLKVLRETGLVSVRRDAQRRIYRLEAEGFREMDRWIAKVRRFWPPRLDALERALAAEENGR